MADLQGASLTDEADQDEAVMDTQLLQERTGGDEAFIEQLQETLRPLYVSLSVCVALLNPCSAPDSGAMNGRGGTVSLASTRAGNPLLTAWQTTTSVGSIQMILGLFQMKHDVHPHNPRNPRLSQTTSSPSLLLFPAMILLRPGYLVPHTAACKMVVLLSQPLSRLRSRSLISTLCQHRSRFRAWRIRLPHQPSLVWDILETLHSVPRLRFPSRHSSSIESCVGENRHSA